MEQLRTVIKYKKQTLQSILRAEGYSRIRVVSWAMLTLEGGERRITRGKYCMKKCEHDGVSMAFYFRKL